MYLTLSKKEITINNRPSTNLDFNNLKSKIKKNAIRLFVGGTILIVCCLADSIFGPAPPIVGWRVTLRLLSVLSGMTLVGTGVCGYFDDIKKFAIIKSNDKEQLNSLEALSLRGVNLYEKLLQFQSSSGGLRMMDFELIKEHLDENPIPADSPLLSNPNKTQHLYLGGQDESKGNNEESAKDIILREIEERPKTQKELTLLMRKRSNKGLVFNLVGGILFFGTVALSKNIPSHMVGVNFIEGCLFLWGIGLILIGMTIYFTKPYPPMKDKEKQKRLKHLCSLDGSLAQIVSEWGKSEVKISDWDLSLAEDYAKMRTDPEFIKVLAVDEKRIATKIPWKVKSLVPQK